MPAGELLRTTTRGARAAAAPEGVPYHEAAYTAAVEKQAATINNFLDERPDIKSIYHKAMGLQRWELLKGYDGQIIREIERTQPDAFKFELVPSRSVSYTHLTLPTNREV